MRNFEFKARAGDLRMLQTRARELGADLWGDLRQTDTYFWAARGRLKLRETAGFQAELISYQRDETGNGRESEYHLAHTNETAEMRAVLGQALGVMAVVEKRRTLLLLDSSRIHLDNVEGLGSFIELEIPVHEDETAARRELDRLVADLGFEWQDCIRSSYLDLMLSEQEART